MGDSVASYSLKALSEFLADYYGKRVIILLDQLSHETVGTGVCPVSSKTLLVKVVDNGPWIAGSLCSRILG